MPLPTKPQNIGHQYWEVSLTETLPRVGRGQILCGQEFFVVHPPSRYQKNKQGAFSLRQLLSELAPAVNAESHPDTSALVGTKELVRRFEAGHVTATRESLYNQGCGCCADMLPTTSRINYGQAFYETGRRAEMIDESESHMLEGIAAVNDAAFDWVMKCGI